MKSSLGLTPRKVLLQGILVKFRVCIYLRTKIYYRPGSEPTLKSTRAKYKTTKAQYKTTKAQYKTTKASVFYIYIYRIYYLFTFIYLFQTQRLFTLFISGPTSIYWVPIGPTFTFSETKLTFFLEFSNSTDKIL